MIKECNDGGMTLTPSCVKICQYSRRVTRRMFALQIGSLCPHLAMLSGQMLICLTLPVQLNNVRLRQAHTEQFVTMVGSGEGKRSQACSQLHFCNYSGTWNVAGCLPGRSSSNRMFSTANTTAQPVLSISHPLKLFP